MATTASPGRALRELWREAPPARPAIVGAAGLAILSLVIIGGQALAIADLAARLARGNHEIHRDLLALLVLVGLRAAQAAGQEWLTRRLAAPWRRDCRRRLLTDGRVGADDVVLASQGVDDIESYLATVVPSLVLSMIAPVAILGWMALTDWLSAVIVLVTLAVVPVAMVLLGLAARDEMASRWAEHERLTHYFADLLHGLGTLRAFNRDDAALQQLDEVDARLRQRTVATLKVAFLSGFSLEMLSSLGTAMVAMALGLRLIAGHLSLGPSLAVLIVTPEIYLPLRQAAAKYHAASDALGAAAEINARLTGPTASRGALPAPSRAPRIELVEVSVGHDTRLHDQRARMSAVAEAGQLVALTGRSGSGKSTLLRAIRDGNGDGDILIDGVPLREIELEQWSRVCHLLPQSLDIPGETVREAVAWHRPVSDDDIRRSLILVGLELDLDHPLHHGGVGLSAGQRRRVALARTVVDRPLVVLADEPTSHIDETSAQAVRAALRSCGATVIVATHDDVEADRTWSLEAPSHV